MSSRGWITYVLWNWYRLRHIPGPFWICSTKLWQITTQIRGKWYLELKKIGDQYGMFIMARRPFPPTPYFY